MVNFTFRNNIICGLLLLAGLQAKAQTKAPATFKLFFEKVYLHTDRDSYVAGEDLWFKAYLVNAQNNTPINTSGNLYVELIAANAIVMSTEVVRLDDGIGNGDFKLKDSIPEGKYRIRAYTNWMRNFGSNFIFEKSITILDNVVKAEAAQAKPEGAVIRFFPEGGSLLNDVSSQLGVKITDQYGRGVAGSGEITASSGRSITKFTCDSLGFGVFTLVPDETQQYTAAMTIKGQKYTAALPDAAKLGFTMGVSTVDSTTSVAISCNNATLLQYGGHNFVVIGRHGGKVYFKDQVNISSTAALAQIPDRNFPEGIAEITLYDDHSKPLCQRLTYITHPTRAVKLSVMTDKGQYQGKEKVNVKIKVSNTALRPEKANLSMAVVDAGIVPVQAEDIAAYLLLKSEVRGEIEQPKRYFDTTNVNRAKQLDLLLMTQGWRDFIWKRLADTTLRIAYLAEDGYTVAGKVRHVLAKSVIPNVNITLSAPHSKGQKLFSARTDSLGRFFFDGVKAFGESSPIRLTARDDKGKGIGWIVIDTVTKAKLPVGPIANVPVLAATPAINNMMAALQQRRIQAKKFNLADTIALKEVTIKGSNGNTNLSDQIATKFGYPDEVLTVGPKDLTYNTVGDYILHESKQAHPARESASGASDNIIEFLADGKGVTPRIIANGKEVPFTDDDPPEVRRDYYLTYYGISMDKVEKVVIKHLMSPQMTGIGADGIDINGNETTSAASTTPIKSLYIISLTLKPGALDRKKFDVIEDEINGYYTARVFYKPVYAGPSAKNDVRTTIHWEPMISTNTLGEANISFYNADPKDKVRIIVQGLTEKGVPIAGTAVYTVK